MHLCFGWTCPPFFYVMFWVSEVVGSPVLHPSFPMSLNDYSCNWCMWWKFAFLNKKRIKKQKKTKLKKPLGWEVKHHQETETSPTAYNTALSKVMNLLGSVPQICRPGHLCRTNVINVNALLSKILLSSKKPYCNFDLWLIEHFHTFSNKHFFFFFYLANIG